MRRNIAIVCILATSLLIMGQTVAHGSKINWVMEKWTTKERILPSDTGKNEKLGQVILTLDLESGTLCETSIPVDWIPLETGSVSDRLFFAHICEIGDGKAAVDVMSWNGEDFTTCGRYGYVSSMGIPYLFYDGMLFCRNSESYYAGFDEEEKVTITSIGDEGKNTYDVSWDAYTRDHPLLIRGNTFIGMRYVQEDRLFFYVSQREDDASHSDIGSYIKAGYNNECKYIYDCYAVPMAETDESNVLLWMQLSYCHVPCAVVWYQTETRDAQEMSALPMEYRWQLCKADLDAETVTELLTENGSPICVTNMEPQYLSYSPSEHAVYTVFSDYYPTTYVLLERSFEGRTVLARTDLNTGSTEILYETGYETPDLNFIYDCTMEVYGTVRVGGEPASGHEMTEEREAQLYSALYTKPISESVSGTIGFFPDNISLAIVQ